MRVREDTPTRSSRAAALLHPWDGVTEPIDPAEGKKQGKYTWAKAPRYDVPGVRATCRSRPGRSPGRWQPARPDARRTRTTTALRRHPRQGRAERHDPAFARMHEAPKYYQRCAAGSTRSTSRRASTPSRRSCASGKGFGATEAARGALSDWIVLEDGKIENYQVSRRRRGTSVRATARGVRPDGGRFVGTPIHDVKTRSSSVTSPAASIPAWSARCTPTTARPARSWRSSASTASTAAAESRASMAEGRRTLAAASGLRRVPRAGRGGPRRPRHRRDRLRQPAAL
jgi:hypothetical protein